MRQFDFARNWRRRIAPVLDRPAVVTALHLGMGLLDLRYRPGDPPWLLGRGPENGQRAREGCLSWYQPWGRCHHIAPFSWAVGRELFPDLRWGFVSGDRHTVVVGYRDEWERPERVLDILLFRTLAGGQSLGLALDHGGRFYPDLARYAASFCTSPAAALEAVRQLGVAVSDPA
jgi:hypothetical protein